MSAPGTLISALWFDHKGCGPSELALQLHPFDAEMDGRIPAKLGLRVVVCSHSDGSPSLVISAAEALIDGGFLLGRDQVEDLHRQTGAWLAATATSPASSANDDEQPHVVNLTKLAEIIAALPECAGPRTRAGHGNTSEVTTIVSEGRYVEYITWLAAMVKATPVLIEVTRAAKAWASARPVDVVADAWSTLLAALAKVSL